MVTFPNCKINLGLKVLGKRADGFHDIETVFYPLPFTDALEIITHPNSTNPIKFSSSGLSINGDEADNLCIKAWHLLKRDFDQLPAVQMHLHKAIPMGAGLGGGSADAAFTLQLLNDQFGLDITSEQLIAYALELGSDCPFFVINQPCHARGRGELLKPIPLDLSPYSIVLVNPGIYVNTGWAFSQLKELADGDISLEQLVQQPVNEWKHQLTNDFEVPVMEKYPVIKKTRDEFYQQGALYAAMSGSGSTVYGIFEKGTAPALTGDATTFTILIP